MELTRPLGRHGHLPSLADRIEFGDCWEWKGGTLKSGYGQAMGKRVHRLVYEILVGEIPEGLELDHLCRNILCVNPDHLEPVTHAENMKRGSNAGRTSCIHGHRLIGDNLVIQGGRKRCRTCRRATMKRHKEKAWTN